MQPRLTVSRVANLAATAIYDAFTSYQDEFLTLTRRARQHFEQRHWRGLQDDANERLELYSREVRQLFALVTDLLGDRQQDKLIWVSIKAVYSGFISHRGDWELAETFFNSLTRKIFSTVGLDPEVEFVDTDFETPPTEPSEPIYHTYSPVGSTAELVARVLADSGFALQDKKRDAAWIAERVGRHLRTIGALPSIDRVEVVRSLFYRGQRAYLLGRIYSGLHVVPLAIALVNSGAGVAVDAALLREGDVSILFSFTRSYFHADIDRPHDLVWFLKSLMPRKRVAELYLSVGYNKHGKTEIYRDILAHLTSTNEKFEIAPGVRGMVMIAFTMPGYDLVFKVIKDRFPAPKRTSHEEIRGKYEFVFKHDRAGRLVEAQQFEHLKFDRHRFDEGLLDLLATEAAETVHVDANSVVISHAYVERRVIPLNIYIHRAAPEQAEAAILDLGHAIRDLAASNIFPGDILLKNFGVTRHGRVVFYDYDELTRVTDLNFRDLPEPETDEQALAKEPWFHVGENDIFPQEFRTFMHLSGAQREAFERLHGELFAADFWRAIQARLRNGEIITILPYPETERRAA